MEIPSKSNPRWSEIVTGKKTYQLKFLAAKILLGRLVASVQSDASQANIASCAEQLHGLYTKNAGSPSAQEDLKTIFG
ncbi:MAG: hypothetical protein ACOY4F_10165 [Thermodesulfobacteriota bacterium]